jgi:hypothetical protein
MDIAKELAKGHSKKLTSKVVDYVGNNKGRFKVLIDLFFKGPYRVTQRASRPMGIVAADHPNLILPYLKRLIRFMETDGVHDAVKRNGFRILQFADIPKQSHAALIDLCFRVIQNSSEAVAIRVFAMSTLARVITQYPEIQNELRVIIEDELPFAKPAFRSRGLKILKQLSAPGTKKDVLQGRV